MFRLTSFMDVSEGRPGMLIPLFTSSNTNLPYVQEMGEYYDVVSFVPYLDFEYYPSIPVKDVRLITPDDLGLIAFRQTDESIFCGTISDILEYQRIGSPGVIGDPALEVQFNRLVGADIGNSYGAWRRLAQSTFEGEAQRKLWITAEFQVFQKEKDIWRVIDRESASPDQHISSMSLADHSVGYWINWLYANRESAEWGGIWKYVIEESRFDHRLPELGLDWICANVDEDNFSREVKFVLYSFMCLGYSDQVKSADLAELLFDRMLADDSFAYEFVRPPLFFKYCFQFFSENLQEKDFLTLIRILKDRGLDFNYVRTTVVENLMARVGQIESTRVGGKIELSVDKQAVQEIIDLFQA